MTPTPITPVRLNAQDKAALCELAARLGKNRSAVIRTLIRERLETLKEQTARTEAQKQYHQTNGGRYHDRPQ